MLKLRPSLFLCLIAILLNGCAHKNKNELYSSLSAAQIFALGQEHEQEEKFHLAIKDYEALETHYPYGEYSDKGQLRLIYAYYKQGEGIEALAAADRFIRLYPNHPEIDYVYYLKGLVHFDQNMSFMFKHLPLDRSLRDPAEALEGIQAFDEFLQRFPNSQYVKEAKSKIHSFRNQLANHELSIAEYYLKRKAYLAAINRSNNIVMHYSNTEAYPKALAILVKSYRALKSTSQEMVFLNKLKKEFKNSLEYNSVIE
ncbi:MAG: outer membrane protein assembly factor BamD [Francisellaceae bacterium]|nr:outer membrane protein assembly factor BamD [Francisellaceae bacterium]